MIKWNPFASLYKGKYNIIYFSTSTLWERLKQTFKIIHGYTTDHNNGNIENQLGALDYFFPLPRIFYNIYLLADQKNVNNPFLTFLGVFSGVFDIVKHCISFPLVTIASPFVMLLHLSIKPIIKKLTAKAQEINIEEAVSLDPELEENIGFDGLGFKESKKLRTLVNQWRGKFYDLLLVPPNKEIPENIPDDVIILKKMGNVIYAYVKGRRDPATIRCTEDSVLFIRLNHVAIMHSHGFPTEENQSETRIRWSTVESQSDVFGNVINHLAKHCSLRQRDHYTHNLRAYPFCKVGDEGSFHLGLFAAKASLDCDYTIRLYDDFLVGRIELNQNNADAIKAMLKVNAFSVTENLSESEISLVEKNIKRPNTSNKAIRNAFIHGLLQSENNNSSLKTLSSSPLFEKNILGTIFSYSGRAKRPESVEGRFNERVYMPGNH